MQYTFCLLEQQPAPENAPTQQTTNEEASSATSLAEITIEGFAYSPQNITVKWEQLVHGLIEIRWSTP